MARTILHVDMDAFFASVEAREDPSLRGRPVVVGADPKAGEGRGVVAAASYAAREYGIHSAMPISEAYRRYPDAAYLRPRGELYSRVSRSVFEILERYTDLVEKLSIDEAFLDVTASRRLFGDGVEIARKIRREIREELELTASVGVAGSKFVAKVASDLDKPDGLVVVPEREAAEFLAPLEIERLWGAGPRAVERFQAIGVETIGDAAALDVETLVRTFGDKGGRRFHRLCRGVDDRPVRPERERKSLGKESTFAEDVEDRARVRRKLLALTEEVVRSLRAKGIAGTTVVLKLRWEGFETVTRQRTLERPVHTTEAAWPVVEELFEAADRPERRIRLVGVSMAGLVDEDRRQLSLFSDEEGERRDERVAAAVDAVTERYGNRSVTRAAVLQDRGSSGPRDAGVGADTEARAETTTDNDNRPEGKEG